MKTSGIMLMLLLGGMLTLAYKIEVVCAVEYPAIYVDPQFIIDPTLTPGKNFTIPIKTDYNGNDIQIWQLTLNYDPNILHGVNVNNGDLITTTKNPSAMFTAGNFNNTSGELELTVALFFSISEPVPITSGPGTLANVTFTVVGTGESNISIGSETKLIGYTESGYGDSYNIINATMTDHLQHGFFNNVKPIHDVAVTRLVAPTTAVIGELVSISVVVANQGNFTETFNVTAYANATLFGTQTDITLTSGTRTTLAFNWDTTDLAEGNCTITAEAILVGDGDLTNNYATTTIVVYKGMELKHRTPELLEEGFIYVLVETSIFDGIEASLKRYAMDVERSNFSVGIYTVLTNNAASIRGFLQAALPKGLVGCLLVGNVPEAYYESNEWGTYPTDLYYMDLDGVWSDTDGDGFYDEHRGERGLEIWVGTLHSSLVSGDNIELLNNYFEKNHLYRTGKLTLPKRALIYIDDPWVLEGEWMANATRIAYDETALVNDPEITTAWDYRERLLEGYEWISLMCHGWDSSHTFMHHGGPDGGLTGLDYRSIDPHTFFYAFYTCYSASGYDNLASSFAFTDTYGLVAFASRGIGVFWSSPEFYEALSDGKCIGEARLECACVKFYEIWPAEFDLPGYEYFWTIVGDPSLHIHGYPVASATVDVDPNTLNLKSKGKWITCYIEPPEGYSVSDIDVSTIKLNNSVSAVAHPTEISDYDDDGIPDLMVKFNRAELASHVYNTLEMKHGNVTLTISGNLINGTRFEGKDTVKVMFGGDADLNGLVELDDYDIWLDNYGKKSNTCPPDVHPDFNNDGLVDMLDFFVWKENFGVNVPPQP